MVCGTAPLSSRHPQTDHFEIFTGGNGENGVGFDPESNPTPDFDRRFHRFDLDETNTPDD